MTKFDGITIYIPQQMLSRILKLYVAYEETDDLTEKGLDRLETEIINKFLELVNLIKETERAKHENSLQSFIDNRADPRTG